MDSELPKEKSPAEPCGPASENDGRDETASGAMQSVADLVRALVERLASGYLPEAKDGREPRP